MIAAECAEYGTVGENDVLEIGPTQLAANVSIAGFGTDMLDRFAISVAVTDPFVRALDKRTVSWRIHGAAGTSPANAVGLLPPIDSTWVPESPACSNRNGIATVRPVPPSTIGGFAAAVRASWSTEPNRLFTAFTPLSTDVHVMRPVIDAANVSQRRCASRIGMAQNTKVHRLVCLEDRAGTPTAVDYEIAVAAGGATFTERDTFNFPGVPQSEPAINLFSIPRGDLRDVYAITTRGRIIGLFAPQLAGDPAAKTPVGSVVTDVAVLPACGSSPPALLVRVETGTTKSIQTLAVSQTGPLGLGVTLQSYMLDSGVDSINATGCVAERIGSNTELRQIGVIDFAGRAPTVGYLQCANNQLCRLPFVARAGVGFLPSTGPATPERIVSATFDASGAVLTFSLVRFDDERGEYRLIEQERITAASVPQKIVVGNLDGDGEPDLFWKLLGFDATTTTFQVSYAQPVLGERLSALSTEDLVLVDTFVADVTGDGADDLVITAQDAVLPNGVNTVRVLPGGAPIGALSIGRDMCGP